VTGLFDLEDLLNPGNDLVGRGVGWLIKVDDTVVLEDLNRSLGGRVSTGKGSKVGSLDVELVEVL
jgi:hypothetical protein